MNKPFSRRSFIEKALLLGGAGFVLPSLLTACQSKSSWTVKQDDASPAGHMLRDFAFPAPSEFRKTKVLIAGGGVSGLAAARALTMRGQHDFLLLELDQHIGGNSRGGQFITSAYPLGAHYLPIPNNTYAPLLSFLKTHGIIQREEEGKAFYKEEYLCADPDERLYMQGLWQEGIIPSEVLSQHERQEIQRFLELMENYRHAQGADGLFAFDIPISYSSQDSIFASLDSMTMEEWLEQNEFKSQALRWYIDYCCRDDYGTCAKDTSAWAGIHYFAGRKGIAANASHDDVLTWPQGNFFLVESLMKEISQEGIQCNCVVYSIEEKQDQVMVHYYDLASQKSVEVEAQYVISALPLFTYKKIKGSVSTSLQTLIAPLEYAPWVVTNLHLSGKPIERTGQAMAWDNVMYQQPSLGYVNACHQHLHRQEGLVLTHYKALAFGHPKEERSKARDKGDRMWVEEALRELQIVHPNIEELLIEAHVRLWGHAMPRPVPGFLTTRRTDWTNTLTKHPRIQFAHSDISGISIFEEAFYRGHEAGLKLTE